MRRVIKTLVLIFLTTNCFAQTSDVVNDGVAITVETGTTITFQGNFTNQNLGTFDNSGLITLPGNWTNDAANTVFTANTGTVSFLGTSAQTIGGTNSTGFSSLTINNTSGTGVTLNKDISVSNVFTLTSGLVYTTAANILTMNSGSSNGAISYTNFVSGPMKKVGSTNYEFPVGKDAETRPISIENVSGAETFTAEYFHFGSDLANGQDPGAPYDHTLKDVTLNHLNNTEYWILNRTGTENASVKLSWDTYTGGVTDIADLAVAKWNGALWKDEGNGGTTGGPDPARGTVISSGLVTSFGPFTLASHTGNNPLPITLLYFDAKRNKNNVDVKWTTLTEINNDYFTVERSKDALTFDSIGIVKGAGNSTSALSYSLVDDNPFGGISYYRLKQTNYDGNYSYSNIVSVKFNENGNFSFYVFPNPIAASEKIYLSMTGTLGEEILVGIVDASGKKYYSKILTLYSDGNNVFAINKSENLSQGIYFITATSDQAFYCKKLIVQ